jgi:hypothetical protein
MAQNVIATAEELQEATRRVLKNSDTRTIQEKNTEWIEWFEKRAVRLFKDATQLGRYSLTVDIPYQPTTPESKKGLVALKSLLRPMIPGCGIHYIEEQYTDYTNAAENTMGCTMLIEWGKSSQ